MSKRYLSRRQLLATTMGGVLLAPLLRQRRLQAQAVNPRRLVVVFTPDSHPPEWWPTGTGTSFTLQEPLADFVGLESEMLFVRQVDHSWTTENHHEAGMAQLFTGAEFFNDTTRYANGPSVDQILLQETDIRGATPLASIHLAAGDRGGGDKRHLVSYTGPGQPIQNEPNAARAFDDIFGGFTFGAAPATTGTPVTDPLAETRRLVGQRILDVNMEEVAAIQGFLGQVERERLQLHLESLSELETRIAGLDPSIVTAPLPVGAACQTVDTSGVEESTNDEVAIARQAQVQADIITAAFACDRTRVAGLHFGFSGSHHEGLLGYSESWHDNVAHISRTDDSLTVGGQSITSRQAFINFDRFWAGHVAYLVNRLASLPEGNGTMLDNTLIYWGVESGTNHSHNPRDLQYLLIGGRNMGFQLGQVLDVGTASAHQLHTSVMQGLGHVAATGIGIEPNSGPLPGVLA